MFFVCFSIEIMTMFLGYKGILMLYKTDFEPKFNNSHNTNYTILLNKLTISNTDMLNSNKDYNIDNKNYGH